MEMELNEYDLISEVQIHYHFLPITWELVILETSGLAYSLIQHNDENTAIQHARVIQAFCSQPITIKLVFESGKEEVLDLEKMTKKEVAALNQRMHIYFNPKRGEWEIFCSNAHTSYVTGGFGTEEAALQAVEAVLDLNQNCQIVRQFSDNTCRARRCIWNADDSCMLLPRSSSLPPAEEDLTIQEWTEFNHPMPRTCFNYTSIEEEWTYDDV
jgi:hypothetical protein